MSRRDQKEEIAVVPSPAPSTPSSTATRYTVQEKQERLLAPTSLCSPKYGGSRTTNGRAIIAPLTGLYLEPDCNTCVASLALDMKHTFDQSRGRRSSTVTKIMSRYSHQRGRRIELLSDCRVEIKRRRLQSFQFQRHPLHPAQQHATQSKTSKNCC